jgi:hypothetical protein
VELIYRAISKLIRNITQSTENIGAAMSTLSDIRYQCVSFALSDADGDERKAIKLAIDSYEDDIGRCASHGELDDIRLLVFNLQKERKAAADADHNKRMKVGEERYRRMKSG